MKPWKFRVLFVSTVLRRFWGFKTNPGSLECCLLVFKGFGEVLGFQDKPWKFRVLFVSRVLRRFQGFKTNPGSLEFCLLQRF
jgi:hypothetical protein